MSINVCIELKQNIFVRYPLTQVLPIYIGYYCGQLSMTIGMFTEVEGCQKTFFRNRKNLPMFALKLLKKTSCIF